MTRGKSFRFWIGGAFVLSILTGAVLGAAGTPDRITQDEIASGERSLDEILDAGLTMFSQRFTTVHGFGDGPLDVVDTVMPGGRPTLGGNGLLLRINGLDGQSCVECHSVIRADEVPPVFGVGGVGGAVSNAMIMPTEIDPADLEDFDGNAAFNGRVANPPFVFGLGAVELLGIEMTEDLQALAAEAIDNPGTVVELVTKGISFGSVVADGFGELDTSAVEGINPDLVVRPFGRKGEFATARDFDIGAMRFHFGLEPVEFAGEDVDNDGDGVVNEILIGELSALSAFVTTMPPPITEKLDRDGKRGEETFAEVGCASCHVQSLTTRGKTLPLRFPEVATSPRENSFLELDLTKEPTKFKKNRDGGIDVPLFADLKRHDMGPDLAEDFFLADDKVNREFTTARLWGVADTAPYLHDGRASTLTEAILAHGGEALESRNAFAALSEEAQQELIAFLRSLRTPLPDDDDPKGKGKGKGPKAADFDTPRQDD